MLGSDLPRVREADVEMLTDDNREVPSRPSLPTGEQRRQSSNTLLEPNGTSLRGATNLLAVGDGSATG